VKRKEMTDRHWRRSSSSDRTGGDSCGGNGEWALDFERQNTNNESIS
jgi:hypothetical protein